MSTQGRTGAGPLVHRTIHHIGYAVPDLGRAVEHWTTVYGAGPFFALDHIAFDRCTSKGHEVKWDHSAAFGQWGPIAVELQQLHEIQPSLERLLTAKRSEGINHIAYAVDYPRAESERLESMGFPAYLNAQFGEIDVTFHDCIDLLGYSIEVHQAGPALDAFFNTVADGARDWNGENRLRSF